MKKTITITMAVIGIALAGALIWWQFNKKRIVRNSIEKAVSRGTDSTYYIHYDSSSINALAGSADFYNVVLQSDSLQKELYKKDTSSVPAVIFNVHIGVVSIRGADIPSLLQKNAVKASSLILTRPVITIIRTGKDQDVKLTSSDSLALYEKITGRFKTIQAGEIRIEDGTVAMAKGTASPHTTLQGINVSLKNFKVDSTRNYNNIVSYFINDIYASVDAVNASDEKKKSLLVFKGVVYDAPKRIISVKSFLQKDIAKNKVQIDLKNIRATGLSTKAFIISKQLKADSLVTDGGTLAVKRGGKGTGKPTADIDNEFFNSAIIKNIRIGSTDVSLSEKDAPEAQALMLKNIKIGAYNIDSLRNGTNLIDLIAKSNWKISGDGVSFLNEEKSYLISLGAFAADKSKSFLSVKNISMKATKSREAFVKNLKKQTDYFDLNFNDITVAGIDLNKLLSEEQVNADIITVHPVISIYNDRTVPADTSSKVGKYPHQSLQKLKTQINIKRLNVNNGKIIYTERGAITKQTGDAGFYDINGSATNITNTGAGKKADGIMVFKARTKFLNKIDVTSEWKMNLTAPAGDFTVSAFTSPFNGTVLNTATEPLGAGSIIKGDIKTLNFYITGNDGSGTGNVNILYNGLKLKLLKRSDADSTKLERKGVTSFVANLLVKDKNPSNGVTRKGPIKYTRDVSKSFFNLVWKSIFAGVKKALI